MTLEDRVEQLAIIAAALLIVVGVALIYAPLALIVAGAFLFLSVIDLRRLRR